MAKMSICFIITMSNFRRSAGILQINTLNMTQQSSVQISYSSTEKHCVMSYLTARSRYSTLLQTIFQKFFERFNVQNNRFWYKFFIILVFHFSYIYTQGYWKYVILLLVCDSFVRMTLQRAKGEITPVNPTYIIYSAMEWGLYKNFLLAAVGMNYFFYLQMQLFVSDV